MIVHGQRVRPAAVAGSFYPAGARQLRRLVQRCLDDAVAPPPDAPAVAAVVVPHAGLVYSGPIAASAHLRLAHRTDALARLVLLGPSHRVAFRGIAASSADAFATPLGLVAVDTSAVVRAVDLPSVLVSDRAHADEHSLEVQLPFLQLLLPDVPIVPFVVGDAAPERVADLLHLWWDDPGTAVVISTDLSHYHRYDEAAALDRQTAAAIVAADGARIGDRDACGSRPLRGLLAEVARSGMAVEQIDLRSSGDTAGDRERVVGYGAFAVS